MIRRLSILALVALSLMAMSTVASAAYMTTPGSVVADSEGRFLVAMTVYTGSGDAVVVSAEALVGTENCTEDRRREQNCSIEIATGETYGFIYEGYLTDASLDGTVELSIEFCGQHLPLVSTITVLNNGTVATEQGTLSSLKAQYR